MIATAWVFGIAAAALLAYTCYRVRTDDRHATHGLLFIGSAVVTWVFVIALAAWWAPDSPLALFCLAAPALVVLLVLATSAIALVLNTAVVVRREGLRIATLVPAAIGGAIAATLTLTVWWMLGFDLGIWVITLVALAIIPGAMMIVELAAYALYAGIYRRRHLRATDAEVIVVLGAGLNGDSVTPLLAGRLDRAVAAARDMTAARHPLIVVSGGKGSDEKVSEASAMARYLRENTDIPAASIIEEDQSTTTEENLANTIALLAARSIDWRTMVVVTSNFHVLRTAALTARLQIPHAEVLGARTAWYYLPAGFLREFAATVVHYRKQNLAVWALLSCGWLALVALSLLGGTITDQAAVAR